MYFEIKNYLTYNVYVRNKWNHCEMKCNEELGSCSSNSVSHFDESFNWFGAVDHEIIIESDGTLLEENKASTSTKGKVTQLVSLLHTLLCTRISLKSLYTNYILGCTVILMLPTIVAPTATNNTLPNSLVSMEVTKRLFLP